MAGPTLAIALVAAQLTGASPAQAAPGHLLRVSAQSASTTAAAKSVAAHCPAGRVLVGGGAEVVGGNGRVLLTKLVPDLPAGAYEAAANADFWGYHKKWQLKAYAICSTPVYSTLEFVTGQALPQKSSLQILQAACPSSTNALAAGAAARGANGRVFPVFAAGSTAFLGAGVVASGGYDKTWSLTTYAVCAAPVTSYSHVPVQSSLDSATIKSVTVTCPAGTKVTGISYDLLVHGPAATRQNNRPYPSVLRANPAIKATTPLSPYAFAVPEAVKPSADLNSATVRIRVGKAGFQGTGWQVDTEAICTA